MNSFMSARRIVQVYTLAGVVAGAAFSLWFFWDELRAQYRNPDGTTTRKPQLPRLTSWTDPATGDVVVSASFSRRLTAAERGLRWLAEAIPILLASSGVGFVWGLVHLKIRAVLFGPPVDPGWMDYDDLAEQSLSPIGRAIDPTSFVPR